MKIRSSGYAFWHSFSRLGQLLLSILVCHMNGMGCSFDDDNMTVRSSLFPIALAFVFIVGSSCWGGIIMLASFWWGSSTLCSTLANVITAMWNISHSTILCLVRSSPSLLSSRSTVDRSSSCTLLFRFSNNHDSVSALRFCDPGMQMNFSQYHKSHWDHRIWWGLLWAFCMKVLRASWSVMTQISGSPRSLSSHFLSASIAPRVSCSYVKYKHCASVNFLDMNLAGFIVFQSSPWP